jgi:glucose dehydrogenase
LVLPALLTLALIQSFAAQPADWPTLRGNAQRSGFFPHFPDGPLRLAWRKELWQELTGPRAEIIVGDGRAYLGTYAGTFYAWDARSGTEEWTFKTRGPIGHAAVYDAGSVFFGSMDHHLYALDACSGRPQWRFNAGAGIWVAPALAQAMLLFGARNGTFHAIDAATGTSRWSFKTGDRILTSASISEDGSRVVFGSEDMHVYCLSVEKGQLLWKSRKLAGLSLRDYAPVILHGLAFVTTNPVKDFHATLDEHQRLLLGPAPDLLEPMTGTFPQPRRRSGRSRILSSAIFRNTPKNKPSTPSASATARNPGSPPSSTLAVSITRPPRLASTPTPVKSLSNSALPTPCGMVVVKCDPTLGSDAWTPPQVGWN